MKRIVDIPDEMYDWIDNGFPDEDDYVKLWEKIKQGTPLEEELVADPMNLNGKSVKIIGIETDLILVNKDFITDEFKKIKEEMNNKGWYNRHDKEQFVEIVDKKIAEMKGNKYNMSCHDY